MINPYFTLLLNRPAVDAGMYSGVDIIDAQYAAVPRHPTIQSLMDLSFTNDAQHQLRLINIARLIVAKSQLDQYLTKPVEGGLKLADIEKEFLSYMQAKTSSGEIVQTQGKLHTERYRINRFFLRNDGPSLVLKDVSGQTVPAVVSETEAVVTVNFADTDCAMVIPKAVMFEGITWAVSPSSLLADMEVNVYAIASLLRAARTVPSVLAASVVDELVSSIIGESGAYALSIVSMLVAAHTAEVAGLKTL